MTVGEGGGSCATTGGILHPCLPSWTVNASNLARRQFVADFWSEVGSVAVVQAECVVGVVASGMVLVICCVVRVVLCGVVCLWLYLSLVLVCSFSLCLS